MKNFCLFVVSKKNKKFLFVRKNGRIFDFFGVISYFSNKKSFFVKINKKKLLFWYARGLVLPIKYKFLALFLKNA